MVGRSLYHPKDRRASRNPRYAVRHSRLAVIRLVCLETTGHGSIRLHGRSEIRKAIPYGWFEIGRIRQCGLAPFADSRPDKSFHEAKAVVFSPATSRRAF